MATRAPTPPAPYVPRPRIDDALDAVPTLPATLLVAHAGTGKTAAAAAWVQRATSADPTLKVAWVRGDHDDHVLAVLEAMRCPEQPDGPAVVVVDEIHQLAPLTARSISEILATDPESVRLLLMGRGDPGLVPTALTLAGRATQLRATDLRLDEDGAWELVRPHLVDTDPDVGAALLDEADGWAAALVLGARAVAGSPDDLAARAALTATRPQIVDYLEREVAVRWPPELWRVLLTTCHLDAVRADEAALLSGVPDAQAHLERATGVFITTGHDPDSGAATWRYHPLLLHLLRQRTGPDGPDRPLVVEAHHRATDAYVEARDAERALRHAGLTGDIDVQLRVLRAFAAELLSTQRIAAVEEAVAAIPIDVRTQHLELMVLRATLLRLRGRVDAAKATADRALAADGRGPAVPLSRDGEALLAMLELWQARYGWRESVPALERAARVLGCRHDEEVSAHDLAGMSPTAAAWLSLELSAFEIWLGQVALAGVHVQDVIMYAEQVDHPVLTRGALAQRAVLEMVTGGYQNAVESAERAMRVHVPGSGGAGKATARAHLARGWGLLMELRLDEAEAAVDAFEATPHGLRDPLLRAFGRLLQACVLTATGNAEAARRLLDGRGEVPELLPRHIARVDRLVRLPIAVTMGDLGMVTGLADSMRDLGLESEVRLSEAVQAALAGDEQRATRELADLVLATVHAPASVALPAAVCHVAMLQRMGTPSSVETARDLVPDLLTRAAPQRLLWILSIGRMLSPSFADLFVAEAARPEAHPFAATAVEAMARLPLRYPDVGRGRDASGQTRFVLTARELEVLQQLALGGGNADLARALFVSENTVKTHLASIYRKLDVDRRVDALRVARTHGLL
ncbi:MULTISPECIES: LuxR C-terminal-related transcriptional regulator [Nocardioides]|nr:LuxR C-terminal-related transcriptional regulator [Nocardioides sp. CGMCC 1.13656]